MAKILITDRLRGLILGLAMAAVAFGSVGITIVFLYRAGFEQDRARLREAVQSRARFLEAVARFDVIFSADDVPGGAFEATLSQLREAHQHFEGFGETGEFTLAKLDGKEIIFLLSHRHRDDFGTLDDHAPVPLGSQFARPMQLALSGKSGTVVDLDYRGTTVLAAHEPVVIEGLVLGIVAKIDLAEVKSPFLKACLVAGGVAIVLVFLGLSLFVRIGNPVILRMEESERRFRHIFEEVPVSIWEEDFSEVQAHLDKLRKEGVDDFPEYFEAHPDEVRLCVRKVKVLDVNKASLDLHAASTKEELLGNLDKIFTQESFETFKKELVVIAAGRSGFKSDAIVKTLSGDLRDIHLKFSTVTADDAGGKSRRALVAITDITERKRAEAELRKLSVAVEQSPASVMITDTEGYFEYVNPRFTEMTGYSSDEVLGKKPSILKSGETPAAEYEHLWRTITAGQEWRGEFLNKGKTGSLFWQSAFISPIRNQAGEITHFLSVEQDITDRKRAETALRESEKRMKGLSHRLLEVQEAERRYIARELHDEIGQTLTAVKLNLLSLQRDVETEQAQQRLQDGVSIIERALQEVRDLSLNLRPSLLDDLGLVPALRWLIDRQVQAMKVSARIELEDFHEPLPAVLEIACYRIVQEALTNVAKHAKASSVWVTLTCHKTHIELIIGDDGAGFNVQPTRAQATLGQSLGLLGMEERALLVGGRIEFESILGKGTEVKVLFPVEIVKPSSSSNQEA